MSIKKEKLYQTPKEIEAELKKIQAEFIELKKRTKDTVKNAFSKKDESAISKLRKKIGLS